MTVATMTVEQAAAQAAEGLQLLTGDTDGTGTSCAASPPRAPRAREAVPGAALHQRQAGLPRLLLDGARGGARVRALPAPRASLCRRPVARDSRTAGRSTSTNYFGDASPEGAAGPNLSDYRRRRRAAAAPGSGGAVEVPGMHDVGVGAVPVAGTSEGARCPRSSSRPPSSRFLQRGSRERLVGVDRKGLVSTHALPLPYPLCAAPRTSSPP